MTSIRNRRQLVQRIKTADTRKARELALESLESSLASVNPQKLLKSKVFIKDSVLHAGEYRFDLSEVGSVYVVGGGKAAGAMTATLEEILGTRIKEGVVNVPDGDKTKTRIVKTQKASHPIPNEEGVDGARRMITIAENAGKGDLVIMLVSGGGSSLMPLPRSDVTLEDKQNITELLLKSGARIDEINAVRKHISDFKGG